jgi:hypothetical protein
MESGHLSEDRLAPREQGMRKVTASHSSRVSTRDSSEYTRGEGGSFVVHHRDAHLSQIPRHPREKRMSRPEVVLEVLGPAVAMVDENPQYPVTLPQQPLIPVHAPVPASPLGFRHGTTMPPMQLGFPQRQSSRTIDRGTTPSPFLSVTPSHPPLPASGFVTPTRAMQNVLSHASAFVAPLPSHGLHSPSPRYPTVSTPNSLTLRQAHSAFEGAVL